MYTATTTARSRAGAASASTLSASLPISQDLQRYHSSVKLWANRHPCWCQTEISNIEYCQNIVRFQNHSTRHPNRHNPMSSQSPQSSVLPHQNPGQRKQPTATQKGLGWRMTRRRLLGKRRRPSVITLPSVCCGSSTTIPRRRNHDKDTVFVQCPIVPHLAVAAILPDFLTPN